MKNMPSMKKSSFQCEFSDKYYFSSGGLKRHVPKNHPSSWPEETQSSDCLGSDLVPKQK